MFIDRIKVIILDFDGVIIESNDLKTLAFQHVFSRFPAHADAMMAYHESHVSQTRFLKFDHLLSLLGRSGDETLKSEISKMFSDFIFDKMMTAPLVQGAERLLGSVTKKVPVYLASVTPVEELNEILKNRRLLHWFRGVYGCPPWTKPRAIKDIVEREHIDARLALLIGDSAGDQRAAEETGVAFLARNSGLHFEKPLPKQFADLNEILDYLYG
jgi:phosphoglycolate phosphatase